MIDLLTELNKYFDNTSKDKIESDWKKSEAFDDVGPTVEEFLKMQPAATHWKEYKIEDKDTHPQKYGKYLVVRKDGNVHLEVWNNISWAYNNKAIEFWSSIIHPYK